MNVIDVFNLLDEYEDNINELSDKEVALYNLKEEYSVKEEEIIQNTDFKSLYGANNEKVRRNHIKTTLKEEYRQTKSLELSINYLKRRNSFLKLFINVNTGSNTNDMVIVLEKINSTLSAIEDQLGDIGNNM